MRRHWAILIVLSSIASGGRVMALDCQGMGNTNINESYNIDRKDIENCMLQGYDPPQKWIKQGGVSYDVGAHEGGVGPVIPSGQKASNASVPHYKGTGGCDYIASNTKPGGAADSGATDACGSSGDGGQAYDVPTLTFPVLPDIKIKMLNCLSSFGYSMKGNYSKMCISGSASFCGFNVGGGKCAASSSDTKILTTAGTKISDVNSMILGKTAGGLIGMSGAVTPLDAPTTVVLSATGQAFNVPQGVAVYADDLSAKKPALHFVDNYSGKEIGSAKLQGGYATIYAPPNGKLNPQPYLFDQNYVGYRPNGDADNSAIDSINPCIREGTC